MKRKSTYKNPLKPFYPNLSKPRYIAIGVDTYHNGEILYESDSLDNINNFIDNNFSWDIKAVVYDRYNEKHAKSLEERGIK